MTTPTVNFLSYNSTGLDTVKSAWINDLCKVTKTDYFGLQEHFKKNIGSYFKEQFCNFNSYVLPAVRNQDQDSGRAKGGLAQLSSKKFQAKIVRISTKLFRVQAQVIHFPSTHLLWINCYFPTDPQTIQFDNVDLSEVLSEIESVMDTTEFDDVILAGDFNGQSPLWGHRDHNATGEALENLLDID